MQLLNEPIALNVNDVLPTASVCSAVLRVDMLPYIQAHKAYVNYVHDHAGLGNIEVKAESMRLGEVFLNIKKEYIEDIEGVSGTLLWFDFLAEAINSLDSAHQQLIQSAPATLLIKDSFVELVKNCMDEIILGYCDLAKSSLETTVNLVMKIECDEVNDLISIVFADNGRGFPEDFLAKTKTSAARYTHITENRTPSSKLGMDVPDLFGGSGRGLAMLIANVECHADLGKGGYLKFKENYAKPNASTIEFDNDPRGGAVVSVITSISRSTIDKKLDINDYNGPVLNFFSRKKSVFNPAKIGEKIKELPERDLVGIPANQSRQTNGKDP